MTGRLNFYPLSHRKARVMTMRKGERTTKKRKQKEYIFSYIFQISGKNSQKEVKTTRACGCRSLLSLFFLLFSRNIDICVNPLPFSLFRFPCGAAAAASDFKSLVAVQLPYLPSFPFFFPLSILSSVLSLLPLACFQMLRPQNDTIRLVQSEIRHAHSS